MRPGGVTGTDCRGWTPDAHSDLWKAPTLQYSRPGFVPGVGGAAGPRPRANAAAQRGHPVSHVTAVTASVKLGPPS